MGDRQQKVVDPTSGETVRTYEGHDDTAVDRFIEEGDRAFHAWRRTDFGTRAAVLRKTAALLRERARRYADLMATEMGKPVTAGRAEIDKCAWVCDYYADQGAELLAPDVIGTDAHKSYVAYRPLGLVLAVMPWNFPFWQVFRFAAPAVMAGNAGLLKHASNVPGCALAIEEVLRDAGLPDGVFRALLVPSYAVEGILAHPRVVAATLTGSTPAGRSVAAAAGRQLKKTVLELGGSDPYVVLEDADLGAAVAACVNSRLINSGQSCIAAKRFIVHASVYDVFVRDFIAEMSRRKVGPPAAEETELGPLARHDLRDELHAQVTRSVELGAKLLLGGTIPDGPGAYYPATVLADVPRGSPAYEEELFGPVAVVHRARDEVHAIELANDSAFGLGAAVFTADAERGRRIAEEELEAGSCFVNSFVRSDPRLPFGGIKASGYGRELSVLGIREFVNAKTVYIGAS